MRVAPPAALVISLTLSACGPAPQAARSDPASLESEDQRMTFELFAFDGQSYDQIAAKLGIAKATVGTRIQRARQKLRELLTMERGDG